MFNEQSQERPNNDYLVYFVSKAIRIIMDNYYYEEIPAEKLYYAAIKGMTDLLDEYSDYYDFKDGSINDKQLSHDHLTYSSLCKVIDEISNEKLINTYVIKIERIEQKISDRLKCVVKELYDAGITNIIIDLRNNTGGNIKSCVEICNLLVNNGLIFSSRDRLGKIKEYYSNLQSRMFKKIFVITNAKTMSASEVLASALQDDGATVIGQPTYGKGVSQKTYPMFNSGNLRLTVAEYFRRDGSKINTLGVQPNIICEDSDNKIFKIIVNELMLRN